MATLYKVYFIQCDPTTTHALFAFHISGSKGRFHWMPQEGHELHRILTRHESLWLPLVREYMLASNQGNGRSEKDLFLSEAQVIVSTSKSTEQPWHVDNSYCGLTVVVPLLELHQCHGPTQFIRGSFSQSSKLHYRLFQMLDPLLSLCAWRGWPAVVSKHFVSPVDTQLGDAIVFDARTLHRGLGNCSKVGVCVCVDIIM